MHADRRVRPHCDRRFGDHAELAIAQNRALEQFRVLAVGAFNDFAGRRDYLQRDGLIGASAQAW